MGKILVGQKSQKVYESGNLSLGAVAEKTGSNTPKKIYTEEEKKKILDAIVTSLPKARIPAALRSSGLNEEADFYEKKFAEEEEQMKREIRLKEILALPEEEQLPLLLAEGYNDEAKELSERLSAAKGDDADAQEQGDDNDEKTDDGTVEENEGEEVPTDGTTSELTDDGTVDAGTQEAPEVPVDQEKKKAGRPKKESK